MKFTIYQESRIGERKLNQDRTAYSYSRQALLMLVADGMGGHAHGEIAAQIAAQTMVALFQQQAQPELADPQRFLTDACNEANRKIVDHAFAKSLSTIPCTTIVACVVQANRVYWAHAGDSRFYLLRKNRIIRRSRDHSRVQELMAQGVLDQESAAHHPERNRVLTCLGGTRRPHIEHGQPVRLRDDDRILLCSDGFWSPLKHEDILQGYAPGCDIHQATRGLLDLAQAQAGKQCDNLSAIALRWIQPPADEEEQSLIGAADLPSEQFSTYGTPRRPYQSNQFALTDEEIEKTISAINASIRKYNK